MVDLEAIAFERFHQTDAERNAHVEKILHTPLGLLWDEIATTEAFFAQKLRSFTGADDDDSECRGCQECGLQREDAAVALRLIRASGDMIAFLAGVLGERYDE